MPMSRACSLYSTRQHPLAAQGVIAAPGKPYPTIVMKFCFSRISKFSRTRVRKYFTTR